MNRLIAMVCIDEDFAFKINYYYDFFGKIKKFKRIVYKSRPETDSISGNYPVADFYEREIHESFGVNFIGGSNESLFLPDTGDVKNTLARNGLKKIGSEKNA